MIVPVLLTLATVAGQASEPLAELKGEYLSGRKAVLPSDARGKVALLALGFSYDSRFAVEAWIGAFRKQFGVETRVTFYEVPMIGGMARMGKWFIDSGMRRGTPKSDHDHVITVYGGVDPWKQRLGFTDAKFAYLVLLDPDGRVQWRHSGMFDEKAFGELASATTALLPR